MSLTQRIVVQPGEDLQAAIDGAEAPGVVLVAPGVHAITTLQLKSGIVLRGADKASSILEIQQDGSDFMQLIGVDHAGLQDLTIRHRLVDSIPEAKFYCQYEAGQAAVEQLTELRPQGQNTIKLSKAKNCWIQNCNVVKNISRVLRIEPHHPAR